MTDRQMIRLRVFAADGIYALPFELDLADEASQIILYSWKLFGAKLEHSRWTGQITVQMDTAIAERWLRHVTRHEHRLRTSEVLRALRWLMTALWEMDSLGPSSRPVSGIILRLFEALTLALPQPDRLRYRDEWRSEWFELRTRHVRQRLVYLCGLLRSVPSLVIVTRWPRREAA